MDDAFKCHKNSLFHEKSEVRASTLRTIRHLLKDESSAKALLRADLPIFIVRSIDIVLENRTERIQALRLMRKFLSISPHLFPPAFTQALIAIAQDGQIENDTLTRACWALLAELAIMSPLSATRDTHNSAFNALMDAALAGNQSNGMCESLISTLLYMLNWPRYRCHLKSDLDLQIFVAPFTDSHYAAPITKTNQKQRFVDNDAREQLESKFTAAKTTMISILRSWQGLIYLCEPQSSENNLVSNSNLKSLINMLYLPCNDVRRRLISLIFELLYIPLPESIADFESGISYIEKHQLSQESWKIHDAFVVDEAKSILKPLRNRSRMNLVSDYLALLLVALFHCNIVDALSDVIICPSNEKNSLRATVLLYQLLALSYQYLPTDSFSQYLTLSTLIRHATSKADESRDLANAALMNLGRIHPLKKSHVLSRTKCSLFLGQIIEFCSPREYMDGSHLRLHDDSDETSTSSPSSNVSVIVSRVSTLTSTTKHLAKLSSDKKSSKASTMTSSNTYANHLSNEASLPTTTTTTNECVSNASSTSTLVNVGKTASVSRSHSMASRTSSLASRSPSLSSAKASIMNLLSMSASAVTSTLNTLHLTLERDLKSILEQDWQAWDWEHINLILTRPPEALKKYSHHHRAFMRKLIHFYKPSSNQFAMIDINSDYCRQLCETGCNLVDYLTNSNESKMTDLLEELLYDIAISMHDGDCNNHHLHHMHHHHHHHFAHHRLFDGSGGSAANAASGNIEQPYLNNHIPNHLHFTPNAQDTIGSVSSNYSDHLTAANVNNNNNNNNNNSSNNNKLHPNSLTPILAHHHTPTQRYSAGYHADINILSPSKLSTTMSSTYFLFIGRLSSTQKGYQLLEKSSIIKIIHDLTQTSMMTSSPPEVYVRLIISSLDYTKEFNGSRRLLEQFMFEHPEEIIRIYATNFLRVLLRSNLADFSSWAMGLLVRQLDSELRMVHHTAADILDEACDLDVNLLGLVSLRHIECPGASKNVVDILRASGDCGLLLLCRYVSSPQGLRYLIETPHERLTKPLDSIAPKVESEFDFELKRWQQTMNYKYVKLVEDVLNNSLTYHQKGEDGKYGRRIDRVNLMKNNSLLPPHFYGQLALHSDGTEIMMRRRLMEPVYAMLRKPPIDLDHSDMALIKMKSALWILGNVGASETGYQLLDNSRELIKIITDIARSSEVLSLRGTAFYVLGLLGSTDEGAEELKMFNWIVRKGMTIALPAHLNLILSKPKNCDEHSATSASGAPHNTASTLDVPSADVLHPALRNAYTMDELRDTRKEIMRQVNNLCCNHYVPVETRLINLKRKHLPIFQYDMQLYAEVCRQLSQFNFRLQARRLLQELFLEIEPIERQ